MNAEHILVENRVNHRFGGDFGGVCNEISTCGSYHANDMHVVTQSVYLVRPITIHALLMLQIFGKSHITLLSWDPVFRWRGPPTAQSAAAVWGAERGAWGRCGDCSNAEDGQRKIQGNPCTILSPADTVGYP